MEEMKRAMSVGEAAKAAGVGRTTLFEEIREGRITARKVGRRTIITVDEFRRGSRRCPPLGKESDMRKSQPTR